MADLWPWLAVAGAGAWHGLSPANGWAFAAAWGLRTGNAVPLRRVLMPIAIGHVTSVVAVAGALVQGLAADRGGAQVLAVVLLVPAGLVCSLGGRCAPRRPLAGPVGLTLWSFLMATVQGAGLMLVPALVPLCLADGPARTLTATGSLLPAVAAVIVHLAAMLATTGLVAAGVCRGVNATTMRLHSRRGSMAFYEVFARAVALVGAGAIRWRRRQGSVRTPALGTAPLIPAAQPQGRIPTLKMPTARGWSPGQLPTAAPGLKVNAYAAGLKHPRWIQVLPNGDVTVAEALQSGGRPRSLFDHAMVATMRRAAAIGESPNRITLLRDADGDGVAEQRHVLLEKLNQPFGMALLGDTFYVGNTDGVVAFPYRTGDTRITAPARRLTSFKPGGHWTRSLLPSPDGRRLYIGVGSLSNIAEHGLAAEQGRACIHELDLATNHCRVFAAGLRNPVGLAWEPVTGRLWTVVNERDGLGDETPPDYLTSVIDGGFYGWPYCYWGKTVDERVPQDAALVARALTPDYALGGHTASLGLCWMPAGTLPGFDVDGMAIGQHGSWNRSTLSGYRVVFVPFADGRPAGPPRDILWGFLAPDESVSYGRPVGVAIGPDQRSLLVADDVGDVIWRVAGAAA